MKHLITLIVLAITLQTITAQNTTPLYKNETASFEERTQDLISRMSLDEKFSQLRHEAPEIKRLGIPAYNWWNECLHGVARAGMATVYPQSVGLGATFDEDLIFQIATEISDEARAKHHFFKNLGREGHIYEGLTFWSPNINIFRDPRWGRGQETYGEDPYLVSRMGVNFIKGLQGDDEKYLKLVATAKHFAVHSGPEPMRHKIDLNPSERDLWETYFPAFEASVKEARVHSVMCAYNSIKGKPCCGNSPLLKDVLTKKWGFDGYVVSDCWAITDFYQETDHHVVQTEAEAAAMALKAGTQLNCGSTFKYLRQAYEQKLISEADIDNALYKLFLARFKLGMFDDPAHVEYSKIPYSVVCSPEHQATALDAARKSIVLLKNDYNTLPLSKKVKSIAVVGPNSNDYDIMLGNYNGYPKNRETVLDAIKNKVGNRVKIRHVNGCDITPGISPLTYIPAEYFSTSMNGEMHKGLKGEYFRSPDLSGKPVKTRIDNSINFMWMDNHPLGENITDGFSVRWTGYLTTPETGEYRFDVKACEKLKIVIDDSLYLKGVDEWNYRGEFTARFEKNTQHKIRIEYTNIGPQAQAHLYWRIPHTSELSKAVEIANQSDVVVMVMGLHQRIEEEQMDLEVEGFKDGDKTFLHLPSSQEKLIKAMHQTGKPVILVLMGGSAISVNQADKNIPAILHAWYPGSFGGEAIADVLFGDYTPGGKLPVTFYKSVDDLPPFENYDMKNRTYRYFTKEPLYAFGHGLSYTRFNYSVPDICVDESREKGFVDINLDIKNTGKYDGDEVVQVYIKLVDSKKKQPIKQLKAFKRVHLPKGDKSTVRFRLTPKDFSYWDESTQTYVVEDCLYEIQVGSASDDIRHQATIHF
ncbi:glucan 1,4-alpha-glucosidase [Marinilabiliaceae bacterium JC017]|nr:glucan 1,4-alpha-glucosidase [Marinilabiliaceae bacterium JC017]